MNQCWILTASLVLGEHRWNGMGARRLMDKLVDPTNCFFLFYFILIILIYFANKNYYYFLSMKISLENNSQPFLMWIWTLIVSLRYTCPETMLNFYKLRVLWFEDKIMLRLIMLRLFIYTEISGGPKILKRVQS